MKMENGKEVIATFWGQVKCRGDRQTQWKSGCVKISRHDGGGLCAMMFLNVMSSQVYSKIHVPSSGVSVKSNRVVIEDHKGQGMYVRLSGLREVEESRRTIAKIVSSHVTPTRSNKAEVGLKSLKSPPSSVIKSSTPSVPWTKIIATPKSTTKSGEYNNNNNNNNGSTMTSNGWHSVNRLKRNSLEMENGDIDALYNDENQDKLTDSTRHRKISPSSDSSKESTTVALNNLKANNFYGKSSSVMMSPGLHIKSPRSRIRDQAASSANRGLYSAMLAIQESPVKGDYGSGEECRDLVPMAACPPPPPPTPPVKHAGTGAGGDDRSPVDTGGGGGEANSSIVGFENLGNTCFMNSPLQCLAYLEPLSVDIQSVVLKCGRFLKTGSIIKLLYLLMKDVRKTRESVSPTRVRMILMRLRRVMDGKFAANTQQDAHELLSEILDRCDEEIKELMKQMEEEEAGVEDGSGGGGGGSSEMKALQHKVAGAEGPLGPPKASIPNPTVRNFNSYFKNTVQFQTCKNQTTSQEEYDTTIMLALTSQPDLHLQDCVDNYFKGCEVEMKCEGCKENEKATIIRKVVRRPRCLILNLLRYSTDHMDAKKKLDRVTIPRYISIADFCSDDAKPPIPMVPEFLVDRLFQRGHNDRNDTHDDIVDDHLQEKSNGSLSDLHEDGRKSGEARSSPAVSTFPKLSDPFNESTSQQEGICNDDHSAVSASASSDILESLDKTVDEDSVFDHSAMTNTTTNTTNNSTTTTASATGSNMELSSCSTYESASAVPFHERRDTNDDSCSNDNDKCNGYNTQEEDNEEGESCSNNKNNNSNNNNDNNNDIDEEEYDDGVVTFKKTHQQRQLKQQSNSEWLRCRGGAEKVSEPTNENGNKCKEEVVATMEEKTPDKKYTEISVKFRPAAEQGTGKNSELDDFILVGEVQRVAGKEEAMDDNTGRPITSVVSERSGTAFKKPAAWRHENEVFGDDGNDDDDKNKPMGFKPVSASSSSGDYGACLKVKVEEYENGGRIEEKDNNNRVNTNNNYNNDSRVGGGRHNSVGGGGRRVNDQMDLANALQGAAAEGLMETEEDLGTRMIRGRSVTDYSEAELCALDHAALTEYETILCVTELSRIQYEKEERARREKERRLERELFENDLDDDDFIYNESFLEEVESSLCESFGSGSNQTLEVSASPSNVMRCYGRKRRVPEESISGAGFDDDDAVYSANGSVPCEAVSDDSLGGNQKVPELLPPGDGGVGDEEERGLLCHESLELDEDEIRDMKGLKVSSGPPVAASHSHESRDEVKQSWTNSRSARAVDRFLQKAFNAISGVLIEKNQHTSSSSSSSSSSLASKKDVKQAPQDFSTSSKSSLSSPSQHNGQQQPQQQKVINNSPNNSSSPPDSDHRELSPLIINRQGHHSLSPSPSSSSSSSSHFTKPSTDLCIVSPSKNRNLVKTRDYSRLRSPSASPKRKSAKASSSPAASSMSGLSQSPFTAGVKKGSASKQLRFSDNDPKPENAANTSSGSSSGGGGEMMTGGVVPVPKSLLSSREKLNNTTPEKFPLPYLTSITPEYSHTDKTHHLARSTSGGDNDVQKTSRSLIFGGEDEPDFMMSLDDVSLDDDTTDKIINNVGGDRLSWTPFQSADPISTTITTASSSSAAISVRPISSSSSTSNSKPFGTITTSTPIIAETTSSTTASASSSSSSSTKTTVPPPSSSSPTNNFQPPSSSTSNSTSTPVSTNTTSIKNKAWASETLLLPPSPSSSSSSSSLSNKAMTGSFENETSAVAVADGSGRTSRENCGGTGSSILGKDTPVGERERERYGACTPYQGSARRKINRSLTSTFNAAEGKENLENREKQARRRRITTIEQGELDCSYRLVGVVNHHGESLFAGHYTCSSYNLQKQRWYLMDDKHTEETNEGTVRRDSASAGYVFFYLDKDLFEAYSRQRDISSAARRKSSSSYTTQV